MQMQNHLTDSKDKHFSRLSFVHILFTLNYLVSVIPSKAKVFRKIKVINVFMSHVHDICVSLKCVCVCV